MDNVPPCEDQASVRLRQTYVDGCPVLPKLRCHEAHAGQKAQLLWNFHDPDGLVLDLTTCAVPLTSASSSTADDIAFDAIGTITPGPVLRVRELSGVNPAQDGIYTIPVEILDASQGLVRAAALPHGIVRTPGVYLEEWGWFSPDGYMLFSNQCCLFVRRGLFGLTDTAASLHAGPPTIEEIRLSMRDNAPADNTLLQDIEFDAAEIASAVLRPIQFWNEVPPPLGVLESTTTFRYREMWLMGIQAHLLEIAAHHYRRNSLDYSAAGISLDDKNKEQPYMAAAVMRIQQYQDLMRAKKIQLNMQGFGGSIGSTYASWY